MAGEFVIDAFAGGDAMCRCGGHVYEEIIPKAVKRVREASRFSTERTEKGGGHEERDSLDPLSRVQDDDAKV
jgi:hypothetical protein